MRRVQWLILVTSLLITALAWAKPDPTELMRRSDTLYYNPATQGVTDLAVDLVIDELKGDPTAKDAKITYYYAGPAQSRFVITGLSAGQDKLRALLESLVVPYAETLMPRPSASSFDGMTTKVKTVARQMIGLPDKEFYQIIGTPREANATIKEYRVLLRKDGLVCQIENVLADGATVVAGVENVRNGDFWSIGTLTTRFMTKTGPQWKIDTVTFDTVGTYRLPAKVRTVYRDNLQRPVKSAQDLTITLVNYRINQGVAAAALTPPPAPAR